MATEKKQLSLVLVTYLWLFRIIFHILFFSLIYRNWWNFITHIVLVFKESAFIVVRIFLLCSFSIDVLNLGLNLTLFVLLTFTTAHAKKILHRLRCFDPRRSRMYRLDFLRNKAIPAIAILKCVRKALNNRI